VGNYTIGTKNKKINPKKIKGFKYVMVVLSSQNEEKYKK